MQQRAMARCPLMPLLGGVSISTLVANRYAPVAEHRRTLDGGSDRGLVKRRIYSR